MTLPPRFQIADRPVGAGAPVYVIAELSANHQGDYERAADIVRASAEAGADAVKLQTYTADTMTLDCDLPHFRIGDGTPWADRTLYDLYGEAHTPWDWTPRLMALASELGIHCFSSPFDATAVDFLEDLDVPAWKIASFELGDLALIERCAATGKPVIMSTGMATLPEIEDAVRTAEAAGATGVALLKCTSAYPAPPEAANLHAIPALQQRFGVPVGLSDHTLPHTVPIAAVAMGACIVEKHVTLRRADGGPDGDFSLEPEELATLVETIRTTERALGTGELQMAEAERATSQFRRSLFVAADVAAGAVFDASNVRAIRPGDGLPPKHLKAILGRRAAVDIVRGTPLAWELVDGGEQTS